MKCAQWNQGNRMTANEKVNTGGGKKELLREVKLYKPDRWREGIKDSKKE